MLISDLHIHSRFSRATSKESDLEHLDLWARKRGFTLSEPEILPIPSGEKN